MFKGFFLNLFIKSKKSLYNFASKKTVAIAVTETLYSFLINSVSFFSYGFDVEFQFT